jgi:hypothetical protein
MIFGCKACAAMERNGDSQNTLAVDAMTALGAEQFEAGAEQRAFRLVVVHRGSLSIHFDGGGQNLLAEQNVAFFARKRLQVELNRFPDISHGILERIPLRLASLQLGHQA